MGCRINTVTTVNVTFVCDKDNSHSLKIMASNFDDAIKQAQEDNGWAITQNSFPARKENHVSEVFCKTCHEKKMEELRSSASLYDQLRGGKRFTHEEFKKAALIELGIQNHPRADKAFNIAWEKGHSNGYLEVLSELNELAGLM